MTRYTDEFRASAVIMLQAGGYPDRKGALAQVSRELKCPMATLHRWFHMKQNPPPSELVTIKKEQIIDMLKNEVYHALKEMSSARPDADYRELATAAAILTDKWQLLEGQPTERTATVHELSDDERSARAAALFDRARARRDGRPVTDEPLQ